MLDLDPSIRLATIGVALLLVGTSAVIAGALPIEDVAALARRIGPLLASVVAITVAA